MYDIESLTKKLTNLSEWVGKQDASKWTETSTMEYLIGISDFLTVMDKIKKRESKKEPIEKSKAEELLDIIFELLGE